MKFLGEEAKSTVKTNCGDFSGKFISREQKADGTAMDVWSGKYKEKRCEVEGRKKSMNDSERDIYILSPGTSHAPCSWATADVTGEANSIDCSNYFLTAGRRGRV